MCCAVITFLDNKSAKGNNNVHRENSARAGLQRAVTGKRCMGGE
jgi:hypothetical protein